MLRQHDLRSPPGARTKAKRVGRGPGSGRGTTSGRGRKGAGSRSGRMAHRGFQGWQIPWTKAMPKLHGFTPPSPRLFALVNLRRLERDFQAGDEVTPERLVEAGLIRDLKLPVKVLGDGEITKPLTVAAHRFSAGAQKKLVEAGGAVQILDEATARRRKRAS